VVNSELNLRSILLPITTFLLSAFIAFVFIKFSKILALGEEGGMVSFMVGSTNSGYFGIPVAIAIFGSSSQLLAVLASLGYFMYEAVIGQVIIVGRSAKLFNVLIKIIKYPSTISIFLGIVINLLNLNLGAGYNFLASNFRGAFIILGSMLIGIALSELEPKYVNLKAVWVSLFGVHLIRPLVAFGLISLISQIQVFTFQELKILWLVALTPIAVNSIALAIQNKADSNTAVVALLISTVLALILVPTGLAFNFF
jgi:predicted permease